MKKLKKNFKFFCFGTLSSLLVALLLIFSQSRNKELITTQFVMDTVVQQRWYGKQGEELAGAVSAKLAQLELENSLYIQDSALNQLNFNAGEKYTVLPTDTFWMVKQAAKLSEQSEFEGGGFDITVGPLALLWDVTNENPKVPNDRDIAQGLALVGWQNILFGKENQSVMLAKKGQVIDLGAIAKGYACDLILQSTQQYNITGGYVLVGSNVVAIGTKPAGKPFTFGIKDPEAGGQDFVGTVPLPLKTNDGRTFSILSTSGIYERYFIQNGVRYHHILDISTGKPIQNDLISVSVLCDDGIMSDYLSTHLLTLGAEKLKQMQNVRDYGFIAIDNGFNIIVSDNIRASYTANEDKKEYHTYER